MRSSTPPPLSAPSRDGLAYCQAATPALASTRITTMRRMTRRMSPPSRLQPARLQPVEYEVDMRAAETMRIERAVVVAAERMLPQCHHEHRAHDREECLVVDRAELAARHAARDD